MPNPSIYDFPKKPDEQIETLKRMRLEGERWRDRWGSRWDRNVEYRRGNLWPDRGTKPLFLANLISPTVRRKEGLLVESKPGIDIRPRRSGLGTAAEVLKKTLSAIFDEQNVSMMWESIAAYFSSCGCGFWKIGWDPLADYDAGDICLADTDPRLIIIDPMVRKATQLQEGQYMCEDMAVPYSWVQRMFPRTAHLTTPDTMLSYENNDTHKITWFERMMDKIRKRAGGVNDSEGAVPRCYIQQWWVKDYSHTSDGTLLYPGGRRIWLTGDDVILNPSSDLDDTKYGQSNPYWDGLFPYVMIDNEADLDHPFGHPEVEPLRYLNEAFNAIGHSTVKTLIRNIPWIIADAGAIDAQTLQDIKELEEMVVENAPGRKVDRLPPSQPTAINADMMRMLITLIEMYAGLNDGALQGKGRVEMRSGTQLEGLQQSSQVLIRSQARRNENALERGGQLCISRVFQYYTTDRILTYTDNNQLKDYNFQVSQLRDEIVQLATKEEEERAASETSENLESGMAMDRAYVKPQIDEDKIKEKTRGAWKLFRFKVVPGSTLASTKLQRAQLLGQMAGEFLIPQSMVVREAGFDNPAELREQALKEFQEGQALGVPPPAPPKGVKGKK